MRLESLDWHQLRRTSLNAGSCSWEGKGIACVTACHYSFVSSMRTMLQDICLTVGGRTGRSSHQQGPLGATGEVTNPGAWWVASVKIERWEQMSEPPRKQNPQTSGFNGVGGKKRGTRPRNLELTFHLGTSYIFEIIQAAIIFMSCS